MKPIKLQLSVIVLIFANFVVYSSTPPPPGAPEPASVPIDSKIPILFAIGILLGVYFILKKTSKTCNRFFSGENNCLTTK